MPIYKFKNTKTKKVWTELMGISEKENYLKENPHIEQMIHGFPGMADPMRIMGTTVSKPSSGFRDVLKEVKKKHPRGKGVNTF